MYHGLLKFFKNVESFFNWVHMGKLSNPKYVEKMLKSNKYDKNIAKWHLKTFSRCPEIKNASQFKKMVTLALVSLNEPEEIEKVNQWIEDKEWEKVCGYQKTISNTEDWLGWELVKDIHGNLFIIQVKQYYELYYNDVAAEIRKVSSDRLQQFMDEADKYTLLMPE